MKQIRIGMWETNSSTQHQLALYLDYPVAIPNLAGTTLEIHNVKDRWNEGCYESYIQDSDLELKTLDDRLTALILVIASRADYDNFFEVQHWMNLALDHIRESTGATVVLDTASFMGVGGLEFRIMDAIFDTVYPDVDGNPTFDPDALDHYLFTDKHHYASWCDNCGGPPDDYIDLDTLPEAERYRTWFNWA